MPTGKWGDPSWSNGNVPLAAMTKIVRPGVDYIGPGHGVDGVYLEPGCAIAVNAMLDAYAQQHGGAILPLNEGYRSYGGQVQYWNDYGQNPALAAPPGTSNYGWGEAVDIGVALGSSQRAWLLANGPTYGFNALSNTDPVHFDYSGTYTPPATQPGEPELTQEEIEEMAASKDATIVRDYQAEAQNRVRTALIYPGGTAVALSASDDVDGLVTAHAQVYGIAATNPALSTVRDRFGSQLTSAQWNAFWAKYPGAKVGSFA